MKPYKSMYVGRILKAMESNPKLRHSPELKILWEEIEKLVDAKNKAMELTEYACLVHRYAVNKDHSIKYYIPEEIRTQIEKAKLYYFRKDLDKMIATYASLWLSIRDLLEARAPETRVQCSRTAILQHIDTKYAVYKSLVKKLGTAAELTKLYIPKSNRAE